MRAIALGLASCVLAICVGCEVGPRSGRGLRLPEGDSERGLVAFGELGCAKCHDVAGDPPSQASDRPEVIVRLGGEVTRVASYGELVTAIINPSHKISRRYPSDAVSKQGVSNMEAENFNERMTVAQLIDLTAYLQSRYEQRREPLYVP